jgi:hypothetical protein
MLHFAKKDIFYKTFSFDIPKKENTVTCITNNYTERQPTTPGHDTPSTSYGMMNGGMTRAK